MDNLLEIKGLTKSYDPFVLGPLDFTLPTGTVMGLVGANGAGKTTLIKLILGLIRPTGGTIRVLGGAAGESALHEQIGVVFDELPISDALTVEQTQKIMAGIFSGWDSIRFGELGNKLELPGKKLIKEFSRGMKMKLAIAIALSHNARLLLLDEPTGGLDPMVRSEILDLFRDFMLDESHGILVSSHITSDLAKVADLVTYIDRGRRLLTEEKDSLVEEYGVVRGKAAQLDGLDRGLLIGLRQESFGFEALVKNRADFGRSHPDLVADRADLDDIMTFIVGEARR